MNYTKKEIKEGITIHNIITNKFKTNLYAVFLAAPLTREDVTKTALVVAILRRGTQNIKSQDLISKKLEEMYAMLVQDKKIKEYFDLEVKFNIMIADVNKIIAEAIKDVL